MGTTFFLCDLTEHFFLIEVYEATKMFFAAGAGADAFAADVAVIFDVSW